MSGKGAAAEETKGGDSTGESKGRRGDRDHGDGRPRERKRRSSRRDLKDDEGEKEGARPRAERQHSTRKKSNRDRDRDRDRPGMGERSKSRRDGRPGMERGTSRRSKSGERSEKRPGLEKAESRRVGRNSSTKDLFNSATGGAEEVKEGGFDPDKLGSFSKSKSSKGSFGSSFKIPALPHRSQASSSRFNLDRDNSDGRLVRLCCVCVCVVAC